MRTPSVREGGFSSSVAKFKTNASARVEQMRKAAAVKVFVGVVKESPVDTGRFQGNWIFSNGQPTVAVIENGFPNEEAVIATVTSGVLATKFGDTVFLTNSLPYAHAIEYGGYPNPVKKGTYVPEGKTRKGKAGPGYVQLSQDGFSAQAPRGMVRENVTRIVRLLSRKGGLDASAIFSK